MNRIHLTLIALVALAAAPAAAQTTYKSTMPDGKVIYGDKPIPGASKVQEISVAAPLLGTPAPSAPAGQQPSDRRHAKPAGQQRDAAQPNEGAERGTRAQKIAEAEEALRRAEEAKRNGEEPLPGERSGVAGGGSRLNEDYFERQKKLEDDATRARQALDQLRGGSQ